MSEVSKRYAKALYEIAKVNNNTEKVFEELRTIKQALKSDPTITDFLATPVVTVENKMAILKIALEKKISIETLNTICLLLEKGRLEQFVDVVEAYQIISDEAHSVSRGLVRSAVPLSTQEIQRIEETVNKVTKKKVLLSYEEDALLLGGMIAQVGGWTFDDSLQSHLRRLSEELNRRTH